VPYVRLVSELRHGSEKLVAAAATQSGFYFFVCAWSSCKLALLDPEDFSKCAGWIPKIFQNKQF
jgi:hypothetical protein